MLLLQIFKFLQQYLGAVLARMKVLDGCRLSFSVGSVYGETKIAFVAHSMLSLNTKTKKVGVLATKGTLASSLFHSTTSLHTAGVEIFEQEGIGLVERIETGELEGSEMEAHLTELVQPMVDEGIDQLVLGCTHYPFLVPCLQRILPQGVNIVDCSPAVAKQTAAILLQNGLENTSDNEPQHQFYTNGDVNLLAQFVPHRRPNFDLAYLDF